MVICGQCNGKLIINSQEAIMDPSGNTENLTMSGPRTADTACQQCLGKGYY